MTQTTKDLEKLKENDLVSLLLFCVYRLTKEPDYAAISELIYVLDKQSLYKLCATYGGATIKIPTLKELKMVTNVLLIHQYTLSGEMTFTDACSALDINISDRKEALRLYNIIEKVIEEYEES